MIEELETPIPKQHEILVRVKAVSVNPVDAKTRAGKALYNSLKEDAPVILGWDIAGEVMAVGDEVPNFEVGDEVFGMVNFPGHGKAYAEYVVAPAAHLAHKPMEISLQEAAAASLAALTAWQVLVHQAQILPDQRVLIHAAAGGVGHFAVQIAKAFGCYVIGTASGNNYAFLRELGADEVIDYKNEQVEEVVRNVDVVLDSLGEENCLKSLKTLKPGGRLISIVGGAKEAVEAQAKERKITTLNYLVHSSGKDLEQLTDLLRDGRLKVHISHTFAFDEMPEAHRQIETHKTRGKIVVNVE